jgi:hypothetical protein
VVFYQMLSGRLPYRADTPAAMMFQHAHQAPIPLEEVAPEVPPAIVRIVARMMAKAPAESQEEPAVPEGIERLTSLGWWGRWQEWAVGRLDWLLAWEGRARQRLGQLQTTTQQVEVAVAEYEHRCEQRGRMLEEAEAVAAALARQIEETIAAAAKARQQEICALQGHTETVTAVAFLPDERFALSGSSDGTIRRWRVPVLTAQTDD